MKFLHLFCVFLIFLDFSASQATFNAANWCRDKGNRNYVHPNSSNCTQYVKCYPYGGVITGAVYQCQGTTLFNPTLLYCQSGYVCPATTSSTTQAITTVTTTSASTTTTIATTTTATTTTASVAFNANAYCENQPHGYQAYPPNPKNCVDYVYCYPYGGVMLGAVYKCQGTTFFDPILLYCSDVYTC